MAKVSGKNKWLSVIAAEGDEPAVIRIDGSIGKSWYDDSGTSAKEFNEKLDAIPKGTPINLYVNSTGGSVGDGMAIYNAIAERSEDVTCFISGYALSIASVIPLAAGKVYSPTASIWMIHDPLTQTYGNEADHNKSADMLKKHAETMAGIYAEKTGKTKSEVRETMKAETWMSGEDAIAYGLAEEMPDEDSVEMSFAPLDWSKFKNAPVRSLFKPQSPMKTPALPVASAAVPTAPQTPPPVAPAPVAAASPATGADSAVASQLAAITAQLAEEKKGRITATVMSLAEGRIPNDQIERWITRAIADETVIADLRAIPIMQPGVAPLAWGGRITESPDRLTEIKKLTSPQARYAAMKVEWNALYGRALAQDADRERRGLPVAANSFAAALTTNFLLDGSVTQLQNRWAPLQAFSRDFSVDRYKPLATGELKFVTGGSTTLTNATNFESGDSTVTNVAIAVNQYSQPFHVTNSELNSGLRMENLVDVNTAVLANTILQTVTAPMTDANFTLQAHTVINSAAFSYTDLQTFRGYLKKAHTKNAILDGAYYSRLMNTPFMFQTGLKDGEPSSYKPYGWDGIYENTAWSGSAQANIVGFFCHPQAVGVIAGLPLTPPNIPGSTLQESTIFIPGPDITIAMYSWFSLSTRTMWCSYDLMLGASLLDPTAGTIMTSA